MSNLFSNENVVEKVGGNGGKYIYPGIYDEVIIKGVTSGTSKNKQTPFVAVELYTKEGGEQNSKSFEFYMSENAADMSKAKLKHIATKVNTEEAFNSISASSLEEYAQKLNSIMAGRELRMKFTGEEYENAQGDVKEAARIGLPNFAEATQPGAAYPPVSKEKSQLTFDKDNEYDFKKLNIQPDTEQSNVQMNDTSDDNIFG